MVYITLYIKQRLIMQ